MNVLMQILWSILVVAIVVLGYVLLIDWLGAL